MAIYYIFVWEMANKYGLNKILTKSSIQCSFFTPYSDVVYLVFLCSLE